MREHGWARPAFVDARCERACRATVVARRARCGCGLARPRLVEGAQRRAARRADRRSGARQPDVEYRGRASRKAIAQPRSRDRAVAAHRRECFQHPRALPEQRPDATTTRREHTHGQPASGDAIVGDRLLGQEPRSVRGCARCRSRAEVDAYAARLALSTSIAQAYVQLQRAYLLHDVAVATLAERQRIYELTRDRNAAGLDSRLELKQAESAVPATREVLWRSTSGWCLRGTRSPHCSARGPTAASRSSDPGHCARVGGAALDAAR